MTSRLAELRKPRNDAFTTTETGPSGDEYDDLEMAISKSPPLSAAERRMAAIATAATLLGIMKVKRVIAGKRNTKA